MVEGTVDSLRAEMSKEFEAAPGSREPDRSVLEQYGADSTASQIDDLYEQILATRTRSRRRAAARAKLTAAGDCSISARRYDDGGRESPGRGADHEVPVG